VVLVVLVRVPSRLGLVPHLQALAVHTLAVAVVMVLVLAVQVVQVVAVQVLLAH